MNKIIVIGAVAADLLGRSALPLVDHDSNIGSIGIAPGGVARNIAYVLAGLGMDVGLISPIADDDFGRLITKQLKASRIAFYPLLSHSGRTPAYLAVHDADGSLAVGISDFQLLDELNLTALSQYDRLLAGAQALVVDANLPDAVLAGIFSEYGDKPIYADGVSCAKVGRLKPYLGHLEFLKVNLQEYAVLAKTNAGINIQALCAFLKTGPRHILITDGKNPLTYNDGDAIASLPVETPRHYASSLGAGDALLAGVIYGQEVGKTVTESVKYGRRLARLVMETSFASLDSLDPDTLF